MGPSLLEIARRRVRYAVGVSPAGPIGGFQKLARLSVSGWSYAANLSASYFSLQLDPSYRISNEEWWAHRRAYQWSAW